MVTDLDIEQDKDIHLDSANDLATVSGIAQVQQSVAFDVLDVTKEFVAGPVEGGTLGLLEERIRKSVNADEQTAEVLSVDITEYNREDNRVIVEVTTVEEPNFTLEIGV
jgi:hypothetical protein